MSAGLVEAILRRDRLVVIAGLAGVTLASWLFVLAGMGTGMSTFGMTGVDLALGGGMRQAMTPAVWSPGYAVVMFFMWLVMMVAMMLPSASPMLLLFAGMRRRQRETGGAPLSVGLFALGYLTVWAGFSLTATAAQWGLEQSGLLSFMMATTANWLGAGLLIAAGLWQLTPLKHACLRHCRSPLGFLMQSWRPGRAGAFRMGLLHGAYCAGCCWFLMALLFYGGVMNLWWIGGLALYVLMEKVAPAAHLLSYAMGAALLGWGGWIVISSL